VACIWVFVIRLLWQALSFSQCFFFKFNL
jgi:hypothetical protein